MKQALLQMTVSLALALLGCEKSQEKPASKESAKPAASNQSASAKPSAPTKGEPGHEGHDPATQKKPTAPSGQPGHSGAVVELASTKIGAYEVRASRDAGDIKPGGDAPIDVWVDGGVGKAAAVRFWIGTQDARGSIKAKAEIEEGHWHTHTAIPDPLPSGSMLWVEIEDEKGVKVAGSFDMKH